MGHIRYRTIAIPTEIADSVRGTGVAPRYGHPAHTDIATSYGPCRHCLRVFRVGEERRILFTYDPFADLGELPLPGPVFIHESPCDRYPTDAGVPDDLKARSLILDAYGPGRRLVREIRVDGMAVEDEIAQLLAQDDIHYIHVRDTSAGCYDLRVERAVT